MNRETIIAYMHYTDYIYNQQNCPQFYNVTINPIRLNMTQSYNGDVHDGKTILLAFANFGTKTRIRKNNGFFAIVLKKNNNKRRI